MEETENGEWEERYKVSCLLFYPSLIHTIFYNGMSSAQAHGKRKVEKINFLPLKHGEGDGCRFEEFLRHKGVKVGNWMMIFWTTYLWRPWTETRLWYGNWILLALSLSGESPTIYTLLLLHPSYVKSHINWERIPWRLFPARCLSSSHHELNFMLD